MIDVFENIPFERSEFACSCGCGFDVVDHELIAVLVDLRNWSGGEIIIGGNRCPEHNIRIRTCEAHGDFYGLFCPVCSLAGRQRSSKRSQHLKGKAADAQSKVKTPQEIYDYLDNQYPNKYGIGLYIWGVHIDVREKKVRWTRV